MRIRWYVGFFLIAVFVAAADVHPQSEDVTVRTTFLKTRRKKSPIRPSKGIADEPKSPIGLGYSLYQRGADDIPVRVDPSKVFRGGDQVRFVLETNTDGYLYVFHTENDANPDMIFPDVRLNGGDNRIAAHSPHETPSSREPNPEHRWFQFGLDPAREQIHVVVSRSPLPGVPIGPELKSHLKATLSRWRPSMAVLRQILERNQGRARIDRAERTFGKRQTREEREAIENNRAFGLKPDEGEPSVVVLNAAPQTDSLSVQVELVHK